MGSLARKMQRAAERNKSRFKPSRPTTAFSSPQELEVTQEGIFCDCYGTLYSHSFEKDDLLVSYLNAKLASGAQVALISSNPEQVRPHIANIGLNPDLLRGVRNKTRYYSEVFEVLIDDDPSPLRAKRLWHPQNPDFRKQMKEFVDSHPIPVTPQEEATPAAP